MYVCLCHAVTDHDIEAAVDGGVSDMQQLEEHFGLGSSCGSCREMAEHIVSRRIEESQYYAA